MGRNIFYGVCAIVPGGLVAFVAFALVDKETRGKLSSLAEKTIDTVKNIYKKDE